MHYFIEITYNLQSNTYKNCTSIGKANTKTQEGTLDQIRCHIDTLTTKMMSTIEVPNDDGKNFGGVESKLNVTKGKQPVKVRI